MTDTQIFFLFFFFVVSTLSFDSYICYHFCQPEREEKIFLHLRSHWQEAIVTHFIHSYMRTVFGTLTAVQKLKPQPPSPQN